MSLEPEKKILKARDLSRREMLGLMGSTVTAVALAGCGSTGGQSGQSGSGQQASSSTCVVKPQQEEGPFFVDEELNRSDLRTDPSNDSVVEGVPVDLTFNVSWIDSSSSCTPLAGAVVNVWQCNALGSYSDVEDKAGQKFLRGYQVTDESGIARFTSIYPGWYEGRTVHTHFKVRTDPKTEQGYEFTTQLYYDDALTDQIHAQDPYAEKEQRTIKNNNDRVFQDGGDELMLDLTQDGQGGYTGTFDIALEKTHNQT
jgi:protocatechuate 3,4-dioxygenase beta subunit